jgi:hypothetical protein
MNPNEDDQIAAARQREAQRAEALGDYTPLRQSLDKVAERQALWDIMLSIVTETAISHPSAELRAFAFQVIEQIRSL